MSNYPPGVTGREPQIAGVYFPPGVENNLSALAVFPEERADWKAGSLVFDTEQKYFALVVRDELDESYTIAYMDDLAGTVSRVPAHELVEVGKPVEHEVWDEEDEDGRTVGGVNYVVKNRHGCSATVSEYDLETINPTKEALECLSTIR